MLCASYTKYKGGSPFGLQTEVTSKEPGFFFETIAGYEVTEATSSADRVMAQPMKKT